MSVQEIETAISALPPNDLDEFVQWFAQFQAQHAPTDSDRQWDEQIAEDMQAGHLDALVARAKEQAKAGQCWPLGSGTPLTP